MAKVHDRILEIVGVADESDDTIAVSAVNYFRDRGKLDAAEAYVAKFTPTTAQTSPMELTLGETLPPPTVIRLKITFQA
jgi:hypothetical protein